MSESTSMEELAELGEKTLAHYGVKGMRWGVRRASTSTSGSSSSSKVSKTKSGAMTGGSSSGTDKKSAARVAIKTAVTGVKVASIVGGSAVGLSVAIPMGIAVTSIVTDPDFQLAVKTGSEYVKQGMHELGINRMSTAEIVKSNVKVKAYGVQSKIN